MTSIAQEAQHGLLSAVENAHPASIHATMRRKGGWYNLDYGHQLGYGASQVVSSVLLRRVEGFGDLCDTYLECDEYHPAHALLRQVRRAIKRASRDLAKRAGLLGKTWFHNNLKLKAEFWLAGMARWGLGPGYRRYIVDFEQAMVLQERSNQRRGQRLDQA